MAVSASSSKAKFWTGSILTALAALFLLFDSITKLMKNSYVMTASVQLGLPENTIAPIGALLLVCTVIYLIPRTAVLGAVLLTGYLGGAIATHVRAQNPPFEICFPFLFALLMWGGLYLREDRLHELLPLRVPKR